MLDAPFDGVDGDDLVVALVVFVVLAVAVVVVPVAIVLVLLVAEAFLLLLLLPLVVALRSALVARWPIEVWCEDRLVHAEAVRGWGASHRRMVALADSIGRGDPPGPARRHRRDGDPD